MEDGESRASTGLADTYYVPPGRTSKSRNDFEELKAMDEMEHEQFHPLHWEAQEGSNSEAEQSSLGADPDLKRVVQDLKRELSTLKQQFIVSKRRDNQEEVNETTSTTSPAPTARVSFGGDAGQATSLPPVIPQVHIETWKDFMNKSVKAKHEFAIEILAGDPITAKPAKSSEKANGAPSNRRSSRPASKVDSDSAKPASDVTAPATIPERVRINSLVILQLLSAIDRSIEPYQCIVMLRPFKFLIRHEDRIRELVHKAELGEPLGKLTTNVGESDRNISGVTTREPLLEMRAEEADTQQSTVEHLRCLVEFLDRFIKPTTQKLEHSSDPRTKILFQDVWHIFKPGEILFMPLRISDKVAGFDAAMATPEVFQQRYQMIWRVVSVSGGRPNISSAQNRSLALKKPNPLKVGCYYIDFDGRYFLPTFHTFNIWPFQGEREITSLDFFPARFLESSRSKITEHLRNGKIVFGDIASTYTQYYYSGPSLTSHPCGCAFDATLHQEHIESEVIVDFRVTMARHPDWRPKFKPWKMIAADRCEFYEIKPVQYWSDFEKGELFSSDRDVVYDDSQIDVERALTFKKSEKIFESIPSSWIGNESIIENRDVSLLPFRVFAFVLRTRTFAPLWLLHLQPIKPQQDGLRHLQLRDESVKNTIHTLVRTHFIQRDAKQDITHEFDTVRGKGKGLIILLHGAPGVGKTFTAESVAAANGKPLFQISCGDLGLSPMEVEKSLKETFRFAQLWNCVLLLDECDIFCSQRTINDVKRNALVSVFLRVLEFYTGVLFLTTNRVGTLDSAIKSRLTWIAYYPPLDLQQTAKIWKSNIKLLRERNNRLEIEKQGILQFALDHYNKSTKNSKTTPWNGRQIQNAFKVATALAVWDAYSQDTKRQINTRVPQTDVSRRPKLRPAHFQTIADATSIFDEYLQETVGFNEAERAFQNAERADDYPVEAGLYGSVATNLGAVGRSGSAATLSPPPDSNGQGYYAPAQRGHRSSLSHGTNRNAISYSGAPAMAQSPPLLSRPTHAAPYSGGPQLGPPRSPRSGSANPHPSDTGNASSAGKASGNTSSQSMLKPARRNARHRSSSNSNQRGKQESYFGDYESEIDDGALGAFQDSSADEGEPGDEAGSSSGDEGEGGRTTLI